MPLYNNILSSKARDEINSKIGYANDKQTPQTNLSNASMKFLQDHLLTKRRTSHQGNQKSNSQKALKKRTQIVSESNLHQPTEYDWLPEDEYDPMVPNSYEVLQTEYLRDRQLKLAERKSLSTSTLGSSQKKMAVKTAKLLDVLDRLEDIDDEKIPLEASRSSNKGTAIAPPPSLASTLNNTEVDNDAEGKQLEYITKIADDAPKPDGISVAAKIMSKMGYKAGQGLGKSDQGMSCPLEIEKDGINSARIVAPPRDVQQVPIATRVLLLQNMVGPGEVDNELESETKEECKKYGDVVRCLIFEIPNKKVPDEQAVRIFVEFKSADSTTRAVNDLNGRYFGGRVVRASYYSYEKFIRYELGPETKNQ